MATKKKTGKKSARSKKTGSRKSPAKKQSPSSRTPKKLTKRKAAPNKAAGKRKELKAITGKRRSASAGTGRNRGIDSDSSASSQETSGLESGDLQGLSNVENVDSESVDELLEEGNAFEAGIVAGVEDSEGRDGEEVRTREVPEDDVPAEYLDEE